MQPTPQGQGVLDVVLSVEQPAVGQETCARIADRFWMKDWPAPLARVSSTTPGALGRTGSGGVLHAKAVIVDDEVAFVTSANLTEAAWNRNIELGRLVRNAALATSIHVHFRTLIECRLLRPLPTV